MLKITPNLALSDSDLTYIYHRAAGPGGQNVNKVSSAVQLRYNLRSSISITQCIKTRLEKLAGNKISQEGVLVIEAKRFRTQNQNRLDSEKRLMVLVRKAMVHPKKRWATRPTKASQIKRVSSKKSSGEIKKLRKSMED